MKQKLDRYDIVIIKALLQKEINKNSEVIKYILNEKEDTKSKRLIEDENSQLKRIIEKLENLG